MKTLASCIFPSAPAFYVGVIATATAYVIALAFALHFALF